MSRFYTFNNLLNILLVSQKKIITGNYYLLSIYRNENFCTTISSFKNINRYCKLKNTRYCQTVSSHREITCQSINENSHQNVSNTVDETNDKNKIVIGSSNTCEESDCLSVIINLITKENIKFNKIVSHPVFEDCIRELSYFTDVDLFTLIVNLYYLEEKFNFETQKWTIFDRILRKVDEECLKRAPNWDMETFINVFQKYSMLHNLKHKQFLVYALRNRYSKIFKYPLPTTLKFIRIVNNLKLWKVYFVNPFEIVNLIKENISKLTLNETAILLNALNSLNAKIYDEELQNNILSNLVDKIDNAPVNNAMLMYLKFYAYQLNVLNPISLSLTYTSLIKKLNEKIDTIGFENISYAALICAEMVIYDNEFLENVASKICLFESPQNLHHLILIRNALYALTFFNFKSCTRDTYRILSKNLRNFKFHSVLYHYPKILVTYVSLLIDVGMYPFNLITKILSDDFLTKHYRKESDVSINIFRIAYGLKLERPKYIGNNLNPDLINDLSKKYCYRLPQCFNLSSNEFDKYLETYNGRSSFFLKPYNKTIYSAHSTLNLMFQDDSFTHICYLLPQYPNVNILFCLDDNKIAQKLPELVKNSVLVDHNLLAKNLHWVVVSVSVRNPVCKHENPIFGYEIPKTRQFQLLGYKEIRLIADDWLEFDENIKIEHLKNCISSI